MMEPEFFISVDVETAGPYPERYSLLSIGACTLESPPHKFYVELKPVHSHFLQAALDVSQLSLEALAERGLEPREAIEAFDAWLRAVVPQGQQAVFVAFNAVFDWMFVNHYFHHYLGHNPFGHAALDMKSFFMALHGVAWRETSMQHAAAAYLAGRKLTHNALQDALDQAELFQKMLEAV